jgi:mRNA-degrading endonuclease RelE of RelBE toxin-antitoxin system
MSYKIATTHNFDKELKRLAKKYPSIKGDLTELGTQLENNPNMGDEIVEHCFKIRLAISSKNKGKRSGARVITFVYIDQETVFLLSIYDKSEQEEINLSKLKQLISNLEL